MSTDDLKARFGKRIQRCYGCYIAFYLKDMWLAEGGSFFCEHCKDDSMFHFDVFAARLDLTQMPSLQRDGDDDHHHH